MAEETTGIAQDQRAALETREELAEQMVPLIGTMYRDNNVVTSIYGRQLVHKGVIDIIKAHRYARQIDESVLPVEDTYPIVEAMAGMNLGAASVDVARLANKFKETGGDLQSFLDAELAEVAGKGGQGLHEPTDVVLYGFGRIGRLLARLLFERAGSRLRLRAIVVRQNADQDLVKRASLLRRDSIHGQFQGTITVDEANNTIIANGNEIQVIYSNDPSRWTTRRTASRTPSSSTTPARGATAEGLSSTCAPASTRSS